MSVTSNKSVISSPILFRIICHIIASLPAPEECNHKFSKRIRRKDAGIAPAKDYLHHESRIHIQIAKTAVISGSSPFYYSDICRMLVDIVPMRMYTLVGEIAYDNTY